MATEADRERYRRWYAAHHGPQKPPRVYANPKPPGAAPPPSRSLETMRETTADLRWPDTRPGADAVIPSRGKI